MATYLDNSKAKELYYNGNKIKEAYYNGNLVYTGIVTKTGTLKGYYYKYKPGYIPYYYYGHIYIYDSNGNLLNKYSSTSSTTSWSATLTTGNILYCNYTESNTTYTDIHFSVSGATYTILSGSTSAPKKIQITGLTDNWVISLVRD